jgi:hypothetical protein
MKPRFGRWLGASLVGLLALLLIAVGGAGLWARWGSTQHGWITSGSHRYAANGRAIVSGSLDADGMPDWLVAKVRVAASSNSGHPLFVGVGRRTDVDRYLGGVGRSTVEDVNSAPSTPPTRRPAEPPSRLGSPRKPSGRTLTPGPGCGDRARNGDGRPRGPSGRVGLIRVA